MVLSFLNISGKRDEKERFDIIKNLHTYSLPFGVIILKV